MFLFRFNRTSAGPCLRTLEFLEAYRSVNTMDVTASNEKLAARHYVSQASGNEKIASGLGAT